MVIVDTTSSVNSQTGSLVLYGGLGINNGIWSRADSAPQVKLAPVTNGGETSIAFFATNNFLINDNTTWKIGQNVERLGSGSFGIYSVESGHVLSATQSGKVGINNSDPMYNLDIVGNVRISQSLSANNATNTLGSIYTVSGNVGIQTTNPQTALDVNGELNVSSTQDSALVVNGGASIQKGLFIGGPKLMIPKGLTSERPSPAIQGYIRYNSETEQFEGFGAGNNWGSLGGVIDVSQDTKILAEMYAGANDGNLRFITASSERMRVNSSGNVAIGFSSPSYKLDVSGYIRASSGIIVSSSGTLEFGNGIDKEVDAGKILYINDELLIIGGGSSNTTRTVSISEHLEVNTSITTTNLVATGNTNTIGSLVTTGGNIGIGIATPLYKLDVNGSTNINGDLNVIGSISGAGASSSAFAYLTLTSNDDAANLTTGSMISFGGITIQNDTDSVSATQGGSILTAGGVSIGKTLFVGGAVNTNNTICENSTFGNIHSTNSIVISSTAQSGGVGSGGSLTILGGASISKDVYVGGSVTSASDMRLKKDIRPLSNVLQLVDKFQTIRYKYTNREDNADYIGFIAQDFIQNFPELLKKPEDGFYSLDYSKVTVVLMKCIQELKEEIADLKSKHVNM